MTLQLLLVRDDKVLHRFPVRTPTEVAVASEKELDRLSSLCSLAANRKRLRVILEFAKGKEMRFSDVLLIAVNPKLAQDCLKPLLEEGMVFHGERGTAYRASSKGVALAVTMTVLLRQVLEVLEKELGEGKKE